MVHTTPKIRRARCVLAAADPCAAELDHDHDGLITVKDLKDALEECNIRCVRVSLPGVYRALAVQASLVRNRVWKMRWRSATSGALQARNGQAGRDPVAFEC